MVKLKSLIVLGLFLVLPLCKSFIRILEVNKLVLDRIESTIECITDILKSESLFFTCLFGTRFHLWGKWQLKDVGNPAVYVLW